MTARPLSPEARDLEAVERLLLDGLALTTLARRQAGMTQRALADRVGVDHTYLSKIEHGRTELPPSAALIRRLADALALDVDAAMAASGRTVAVPIADWLAIWPAVEALVNEVVCCEGDLAFSIEGRTRAEQRLRALLGMEAEE